jgi:peptidoglycan/xylan/chitin deacetylase (PgdA/CDA1 family)
MTTRAFESVERSQTRSAPASSAVAARGGRNGLLRVLTYHRVAEIADRPDLDPRLISTTPAVFDQQMRYLAEHFNVVTLEEVIEAAHAGKRLPSRAVLITFDDAYCDFSDYAWPVLKRHKLPATMFVPTAYPDRPDRSLWWDRLHRAFASSRDEFYSTPIGDLSLRTEEERRQNLRSLRKHLKTMSHSEAMEAVDDICDEAGVEPYRAKSILGWEELRQLASEGLMLGAHTRTHPLLTQLPLEAVRSEIVGSCHDLETEIGDTLPTFCYPDGAYNEATIGILKQENCALAFTTVHGQNDLKDVDPLRMQRTNITRRITLPFFRLHLSPFGAYIDKWRRRKGRKHRFDSQGQVE